MNRETTGILNAVDPAMIARFVANRRWFGAKDRTVTSATLRDIAPLSDTRGALACVRVQFVDGSHADHLLPLAICEGDCPLPEDAPEIDHIGPARIIDALDLPAIRRRLARAFTDGETVESTAGNWVFEPLADLAGLEALDNRVLAGEQSNTSIVYGDRAILKFFRRLEPGEHPDVEVSRHLATTPFRGAPALLGVARLERDGERIVSAAIQQFMPGSVDGWAHVLARLQATDSDGATLTAELTALGALTRALHDALAAPTDDPAFAPEPTTAADLERWHEATTKQARSALASLAERQHALPAAVLPDVERVLARREDLVADLPAPAASAGLGPKTRLHGDYHLGQTLLTADGWRIIDFEGEPARPLAERRAKHHPLRDVAGMLRSFAYAAAVGAPEPAAAAERAMRAAFLAGYDPSLIEDPPRAALLALFTAEKLFYELAYELGSRPAWVWIPLAGLIHLSEQTAR